MALLIHKLQMADLCRQIITRFLSVITNHLGEDRLVVLCQEGCGTQLESAISPERHTGQNQRRCAPTFAFPFSRTRRLSRGFKKKKKREKKSPLHSLSQLQKERLIFSVRFQIMKSKNSLADVPCFHQADSYLLGFICQQISTM